jgi:hypothetical protein
MPFVNQVFAYLALPDTLTCAMLLTVSAYDHVSMQTGRLVSASLPGQDGPVISKETSCGRKQNQRSQSVCLLHSRILARLSYTMCSTLAFWLLGHIEHMPITPHAFAQSACLLACLLAYLIACLLDCLLACLSPFTK